MQEIGFCVYLILVKFCKLLKEKLSIKKHFHDIFVKNVIYLPIYYLHTIYYSIGWSKKNYYRDTINSFVVAIIEISETDSYDFVFQNNIMFLFNIFRVFFFSAGMFLRDDQFDSYLLFHP